YVLPLVLLTTGYALVQAANNTAVMADVAPDQRGVVSGLLNLSRNLGLITGASAMGAVFAWGAGTADLHAASADAVAAGLRATFTGAAALVGVALGVALLAWWRVVPALHHKPGSDDSAPGPSFLAFPSSARREPACVTTTTPATVSTPTTPTGRC
ncbi:MAG TPA: hypothetical protein VFL64_00795, partial [Rhizobacter sp.]|nr:hypothetical protein [Rhizobacter sp.]